MTERNHSLPDGWRETSDPVPGADRTSVYHVEEGKRVLVGLAPTPDDPAETRLEVASIEEDAVVQRHEFVVETYGEDETGVEEMGSFMELLGDRLPAHEDEDRLFVGVERCIEVFNSTTASE